MPVSLSPVFVSSYHKPISNSSPPLPPFPYLVRCVCSITCSHRPVRLEQAQVVNPWVGFIYPASGPDSLPRLSPASRSLSCRAIPGHLPPDHYGRSAGYSYAMAGLGGGWTARPIPLAHARRIAEDCLSSPNLRSGHLATANPSPNSRRLPAPFPSLICTPCAIVGRFPTPGFPAGRDSQKGSFALTAALAPALSSSPSKSAVLLLSRVRTSLRFTSQSSATSKEFEKGNFCAPRLAPA